MLNPTTLLEGTSASLHLAFCGTTRSRNWIHRCIKQGTEEVMPLRDTLALGFEH